MGAGLFNKYIWLIRKLIAAGDRGFTLKELSAAWQNHYGTEYARRTFNNHREDIENIFGITIECNRSTNRYFIRRGEDLMDTQANVSWLIDTFTVNNILDLGKERLSGRVSVEEIPSGRKFLAPLMDAMQDNNILKIIYKKYDGQPETLNVHPYAVKESDQRWYLIGWAEERNALRIYGLDRIVAMDILPETFKMPEGFDVDELFATSFGPYLNDSPGTSVIIKAFGTEANFIRDLPLHRTQEEIGSDDERVTFRIFVSPNRSMYLELLGHGPGIEVISPVEVRETMAKMTEQMNELYKK